MGYVSLVSTVSVGKTLRCKYPKHGRLNVLKFHEGVIEQIGVGPNGLYARITSRDGQHRTLRCDKMLDASVS
jgi:hypothetical protein